MTTMAPYTGNGKKYIEKQNEYLQRKREPKRNRVKYLRGKVKQGKASDEERKELTNLEINLIFTYAT